MTDSSAPTLPPVRSRRLVVDVVTFLVAFCSIAYELVYSELLRVMYGGTVQRYAITIGLFMAAFSLGSFLADNLERDAAANFFRTEVYLLLAGPGGALFIVGLNLSPDVVFPGKRPLVLLLSHVPILLVGFLSGLELPLLSTLLHDDRTNLLASLGRLTPRRTLRRLLGVAWTVTETDDDGSASSFNEVLGVDYVGSLFGTVVYALVLYPALGLVTTVFLLGLLNGLAAVAFLAWHAGARPAAAEPRSGTDSAGPVDRGTAPAGGLDWGRVRHAGGRLLVVALLVNAGYAGVVVNAGAVDAAVTKAYLGADYEREYAPGAASITVTRHAETAYQDVVVYNRTVTSRGDTLRDRCLRLDQAVQACDSWIEPYHSGLVDVPMTMYDRDDLSGLNVLLLGGGDHVAVDRLRRYDASVDRIDLDGEFMRWAARNEWLAQYHDHAYRYPKLNTTVGDAFSALRRSEGRYDLILLDLPGARSDDALGLYSVEFYSLLRRHLTDRGLVVTWSYTRYVAPAHRKAYLNTVRAAGFTEYLPYGAYADRDGNGREERVEQFYVLSPDADRTPSLHPGRPSAPAYVRAHESVYAARSWRSVPRYRGVRPNSVFHPNYRIVVDYR